MKLKLGSTEHTTRKPNLKPRARAAQRKKLLSSVSAMCHRNIRKRLALGLGPLCSIMNLPEMVAS